MKINSISGYVSSKNFKSLRTDKKTVETLQDGTNPILDNKKENIKKTLDTLSQIPTRSNIEFLLGVAKNLEYGQNGNSEFKQRIDETSVAKGERENTDWHKMLADTIQKLINFAEPQEIEDLTEEYYEIFGQKQPLTKTQEEILNLRTDLTNTILNSSEIYDATEVDLITNIRKNMDYFISSSEISYNQKKECLEKFKQFLSDDYKINPQLEGKKLQAMDEMLNDMVIKTPENDVLTIKDVNQKFSGICAAISTCRKALAYEDKVRYMEIIMDELNDSPYMSVYDTTELGTGKKVNIEKAQIDYDRALGLGYRIIDTSAHNWMQAAHVLGDGSIVAEKYTAFDNEYGIYDDSSWYQGIEEDYEPIKDFLKALIKEEELFKKLDRRKKNFKSAANTIKVEKTKINELKAQAFASLSKDLTDVFAPINTTEVRNIARNLIEFYNGTSKENEVNVPAKLSRGTREQILVDFIKSQRPNMSESQQKRLNESAKHILSMTDECASAERKLKRFSAQHSPRTQYMYNRSLYELSAAHRLALEADLNAMPDAMSAYENEFNIKAKDLQAVEYMNKLVSNFNSEVYRSNFKKENGQIPSKQELTAELSQDVAFLQANVPSELDEMFVTFFGKNIQESMIDIYNTIKTAVENGDEYTTKKYAYITKVKGNKEEIVKHIEQNIKMLQTSTKEEDVLKSLQYLGFGSKMDYAIGSIGNFYESVQKGVSQQVFDRFAQTFGGADNISAGLEKKQKELANLIEKYTQVYTKWNIPQREDNILKKMEDVHAVMSRKDLDKMTDGFKAIREQRKKYDSVPNAKEREKAVDKILKFTPEQNVIFEKMEETYPYIKKYATTNYHDVNEILKEPLKELYADLGMLAGAFWVREEGSSGLASSEQVRIFEQMTDKPYHIVRDINDAAKRIKEGNGSGILSMSVTDDDYGFHAQYVPSVTTETFTDPATGKTTKKDVMWTDNSWGPSEKDSWWNGHNGHIYTDYAGGYGWRNGFIVDDTYKIGLPLEQMHGAVGYAGGEKFGLVTDVIMNGTPDITYQKLNKVFGQIFGIKKGMQELNDLKEKLLAGEKINPEYLTKVDDLAQIKTEKIENRLENEINTKADFDKLPDDDYIKVAFNKLDVYYNAQSAETKEAALDVETMEELEEVKEEIFDEKIDYFLEVISKSYMIIEEIANDNIDNFQQVCEEIKEKFGIETSDEKLEAIITGVFGNTEETEELDGSLQSTTDYLKSKIAEIAKVSFDNNQAQEYFTSKLQNNIEKYIDENIKIKSLDDSIIKDSPLAKEFINCIDKYLQPVSDEELLAIIQDLQNETTENIADFLECLTPEDLGINYRGGWDYVLKYKADNTEVVNDVAKYIGAEDIVNNINLPDENDEDPNATTADILYRSLYMSLADMDVQKYIKKYSEENFRKYKSRQAFPNPIVAHDDTIFETMSQKVNEVKTQSEEIKNTNDLVKFLNKFEEVMDKYSSTPLFNAMLQAKNISVEENKESLVQFLNDVKALCNISEETQAVEQITPYFTNLYNVIAESETTVNGIAAKNALTDIINIQNAWNNASMTSANYNKVLQNDIKQMNERIKSFIVSDVSPRYRNDVANQFKNIISMIKNNANEEDINEKMEELSDVLTEKHILKEPISILNEYVKLVQSGKSETQECKDLEYYLNASLYTAGQTKVQYQLVKNQREGISTKTKDLLPLFKVTLSTGEQHDLSTPVGILYIIEQLKNESDNNKTLNLFLNQAGLTKKASSAIISQTKLEDGVKYVHAQAENFKKLTNDFWKLQAEVDNYVDNCATNFTSFEAAKKDFCTYLKRKTANISNSPVIKSFFKSFKQIDYKLPNQQVDNAFCMELLRNAYTTVANLITGKINQSLDNIDTYLSQISKQTEMVEQFNLPIDCEEYKQREAYLEEYEQLKEFGDTTLGEIYNFISANHPSANLQM